ncbi:hypothetical protein BVY03_04870 [bacterium K02(2017)]|nr:hypothetical protein BVY03_04870 [bacterium K02(2017)]
MELWHIPLVLIIGTIAGFFNTWAGGGSILTLPLLIFLGLPPSMANGTNRVGVLAQTGKAIWLFKKNKVHVFKLALILSLPASLGALIGAYFAIDINETIFNRILAVVIVFFALDFFRKKPNQDIENKLQSKKQTVDKIFNNKKTLTSLIGLFFLIGIYGGFIQVGIGFVIIFCLRQFTDFDLVHINAIKVTVAFIYTLFALTTFIIAGKVDWVLGPILALGTITGVYLGVKIGLQKGEKWIRGVIVFAALGMAVKLIFV